MDLKKFLKPTNKKLILFAGLSGISILYGIFVYYNVFLTYSPLGIFFVNHSKSFFEYYLIALMYNMNILYIPVIVLFGSQAASIPGELYYYIIFFPSWYIISCSAFFLHDRYNRRPAVLAGIVISLILMIAVSSYYNALSLYQSEISNKRTLTVEESYCVGGDTGVLILKITGRNTIQTDSITFINTTDGNPPSGSIWLDMEDKNITVFEPGEKVKYLINCRDLCLLRLIYGGRTYTASVKC